MSLLAQRVRDYRYSKGWGPDELASRAAISRTALYQIESGKTELPRAGTLRRIALALDVTMETLLGHMEAANGSIGQLTASSQGRRTRATTDWMPIEGAPLALHAPRSTSKMDDLVSSRFGIEYGMAPPGMENGVMIRERELVSKLQELLASPLAEPIARIVEESHRLLPVSRTISN
jgi:transcriptional regulator with XRE-family HTH domain